jgi:hypothetical protein
MQNFHEISWNSVIFHRINAVEFREFHQNFRLPPEVKKPFLWTPYASPASRVMCFIDPDPKPLYEYWMLMCEVNVSMNKLIFWTSWSPSNHHFVRTIGSKNSLAANNFDHRVFFKLGSTVIYIGLECVKESAMLFWFL